MENVPDEQAEPDKDDEEQDDEAEPVTLEIQSGGHGQEVRI